MLNLNFARLLMLGSFFGSVPGMLRWMRGSRVGDSGGLCGFLGGGGWYRCVLIKHENHVSHTRTSRSPRIRTQGQPGNDGCFLASTSTVLDHACSSDDRSHGRCCKLLSLGNRAGTSETTQLYSHHDSKTKSKMTR